MGGWHQCFPLTFTQSCGDSCARGLCRASCTPCHCLGGQGPPTLVHGVAVALWWSRVHLGSRRSSLYSDFHIGSCCAKNSDHWWSFSYWRLWWCIEDLASTH